MDNRPINTLFMLMSLDGKINSGDSDELDVDRDWCKIDGVKKISEKSIEDKNMIARKYRNHRIGEFLKELKLTEGRNTGIPKII